MNVLIRPARNRDALDVAALVDIAGHGIEAEIRSANVDDDHSELAAARRMVIEDTSLPYHISKAFIIEVDGEVAGALVGGLVPENPETQDDVPGYFTPLLELESRVPGYWSVIGLAVYREYRGQGLARRLLAHAEEQARRSGAKGLSIVVEDTNTPAITLYRAVGYKDEETRPWLPYPGRSGPNNWVMLTRPFLGGA